jgi:hypothetical protein
LGNFQRERRRWMSRRGSENYRQPIETKKILSYL